MRCGVMRDPGREEVVVGGCQRKTEFDFLVFSGIIPDKKYL